MRARIMHCLVLLAFKRKKKNRKLGVPQDARLLDARREEGARCIWTDRQASKKNMPNENDEVKRGDDRCSVNVNIEAKKKDAKNAVV